MRMFWGGDRFSQYAKYFYFEFRDKEFDNTINKHGEIHRKFIMRLERDVRPLVQSLLRMCSLLFSVLFF